MAEWYWMKHGQKHGPVSTKLLKQLAKAGHLEPTDKIWREGLSGWVSASNANGLEFGRANSQSDGGSRAPSPRSTGPLGEPAAAQQAVPAADEDRSDLGALANAASVARTPEDRRKETRASRPRSSRRIASESNAMVNLRSILFASAVLLTVIQPWMVVPEYEFSGYGEMDRTGYSVGMSWDIIDKAPGPVAMWIIVSWVCAGGIIVASCLAKELVLGIVKAGCGVLCVLLLMNIGSDFEQMTSPVKNSPLASRFVINVLGAIFLAALVVTSHTHRRLGPSVGARTAQAISSGGACVMISIGLIVALTDFADIPAIARDQFLQYLVVPLLFQLMVLAGCIVCLVAAVGHHGRKAITGVGLGLVYSGFGGLIVYFILLPTLIESKASGASLLLTNLAILMVLGIAYPLLSGITRLIVGAAQHIATQSAPRTSRSSQLQRVRQQAGQRGHYRASPQRAGSAENQGTVRQRLADLKRMHEDELITDEEFAAQKARILEST